MGGGVGRVSPNAGVIENEQDASLGAPFSSVAVGDIASLQDVTRWLTQKTGAPWAEAFAQARSAFGDGKSVVQKSEWPGVLQRLSAARGAPANGSAARVAAPGTQAARPQGWTAGNASTRPTEPAAPAEGLDALKAKYSAALEEAKAIQAARRASGAPAAPAGQADAATVAGRINTLWDAVKASDKFTFKNPSGQEPTATLNFSPRTAVVPGASGKLFNDMNSIDGKLFGRPDPEYELRRKDLVQDRGMTQAQFDGINDFFGYLTSGSLNNTDVIDIPKVQARMQELGPGGVKKAFDEYLNHDVELADQIVAKGHRPGASESDAYWAARYEPRRVELLQLRDQLFGAAEPKRLLTGPTNAWEKLTSWLR